MYAQLPIEQYPKFLGYLPEYAAKKVGYIPLTGGPYSSYAFDENGRMTCDRPVTVMQYEGNETTYGAVGVGAEISSETIAYLTQYKEYAESKNAKVYFVSCPTYEGAVTTDISVFRSLIENEEALVGIPYISDPEDYFFPEDMMFDTIYHCNNDGQRYRSELIVQDLRNAGVID